MSRLTKHLGIITYEYTAHLTQRAKKESFYYFTWWSRTAPEHFVPVEFSKESFFA